MLGEKVLIDSDAFIGLQIQSDAHHQDAIEGFTKLRARGLQPTATVLVITETTNLLSRRYSMTDAKRFLQAVETLPIIAIDEELHRKSVKLFQEQTKSKTSLVDMANIVVMRQLEISQIFAFDKVYGEAFNLSYLQ
jgi:predicted nucleic acid-binding protein